MNNIPYLWFRSINWYCQYRSFEHVWKQIFRCDTSMCISNWQDYMRNNKTLTGSRNQILFQSKSLSRLWTRRFLVYRLHRSNSARTDVCVFISIKWTKTIWPPLDAHWIWKTMNSNLLNSARTDVGVYVSIKWTKTV